METPMTQIANKKLEVWVDAIEHGQSGDRDR
jgi:hypothetical protein